MSLKHVILGFLSETPLAGYDLKKRIASSDIFYWSGNSNQIYRFLVELHEEKLVTVDVQPQEGKPSRKVYTITNAGLDELQRWMQSLPDLPQFQNALIMQLIWADQLEISDLHSMLTKYEEELRIRVAMIRERANREIRAARGHRVSYAERAMDHFIAFYEFELNWIHTLLSDIEKL